MSAVARYEIDQKRPLDFVPRKGLQTIYWTAYPVDENGRVLHNFGAIHCNRPISREEFAKSLETFQP
jgi:hypothetical protein